MTSIACPQCGKKALEQDNGRALCVSGCGWNNIAKPSPKETAAEFIAQIFGEGDPLTPKEREEREALRKRQIAASRKESGDRGRS